VHARDKYSRRTTIDLSYIRDWQKLEVAAEAFPSAHHWEYRERLKNGRVEAVPVKVRAMVEEPEQLDPTLGDIGWAYDFAYGIASDFVHPRPVGMRAHVADPGGMLAIRSAIKQGRWAETAVVLGVYSFSLSVKRALLFWGLEQQAEKYEQIVNEHWLPIMHYLNGEDVQGLPQV